MDDVLSRSGQKRDYAHTHDIDLEQALLGSIIVNQKLLVLASEHLAPEHLSEPIHQAIYELMLEQDTAGKTITPLTLGTWLRHDPRFEELGGTNYLTDLALGAPAMPAIADLAKTLTGYAMRRRGLEALEEAKRQLYEGKSITAALADVVVAADEITAREAEGADNAGDAGEIAYQLFRDIDTQAVSEIAYGCPTGIRSLDNILGGLIPGNFIVIGGRPGMGKTIVGAELAMNAARFGWEPDYFSLEMPRRELAARMASSIDYDVAVEEGRKPVQYKKLIQLSASAEERSQAARAQLILRELPIKIFDFEAITMARIAAIVRARAAKAKRRGKRKLTIIDHLGLIEPDERYRGRKVDELTLITKRTKQLAKQTEQPIVMLAQLNREVEGRDDKRPRMSDFRDSGSIEQDADVLIGLYRHDFYAAQKRREAHGKSAHAKTDVDAEADRLHEILEEEVLKNRNGETDTARCHIKVAVGALRNEKPIENVRQEDIAGLIPQ